MVIRNGLAGAMVLAIFAAAPAAALFTYTSCSTGTVKSCASIEIQTFKTGLAIGAATRVVAKIRNLQGFNILDNTNGSKVTAWGIVLPDVGTLVGAPTITLGGTGAVANNNPYANWGYATSGTLQGGGTPTVEFRASTSPGNSGGIRGCTNAGGNATYFQACAPGAWIQFEFQTTGNWNDTDGLVVAWRSQAWVNSGGSVTCVSDGSGAGCTPILPDPSLVIPEPITMVLVGSGLAGIGVISRRRRRGVDVVSE